MSDGTHLVNTINRAKMKWSKRRKNSVLKMVAGNLTTDKKPSLESAKSLMEAISGFEAVVF